MSDPLPMFPLNTVVFPGMSVPLHVFEDRYRMLVRHLLTVEDPAQRVFGTVAIREGYEVGDHGAQSVYRIGCVLQLTEVDRRDDGTFDIVAVARDRLLLEEMQRGDEFPHGVAEVLTTADLLRHERVVDPDEDPQTTYAHILVDEGQDVTPMQWRMLRRRGPQSSWTIVGDPAQSSYPDQAETRRALDELIGRAPSRTFKLSTNYRSPSEVFNLASRVITKVVPDADLPHAVRSTGVEPTLAATSGEALPDALRHQLLELAAKVNGTIGVICPPSRIREVQRSVMGDSRLGAFEDRIIVVTALQAKGLEYDGVLVVSPDEIVAQAPGGIRVLYVALTRATQRMTTLDVDTSDWRALLA